MSKPYRRPSLEVDVADWRHETSGAKRSYRNRTLDAWLVLALVLGGFAAATLASPAERAGPAPPFSLVSTGFENGTMGEPTSFSLADYRGKTVLLDFMAVTCITCRAVTEDVLKPLHERHPDLVILSIDTWSDPGASGGVSLGGETDADVIRLQQQEGVPWRHARDTDQVYLKYAAISLPKLAVVDPDGDLVYAKAGPQSLARVEAAVSAATANQAVPIPQLQIGFVGFAVLAGLACVVTPCGVGLLPAYLGLLLEDGKRSAAGRRVARAVAGGATAAAAIVALYAVLAVAAWAAGDALRAGLPWLGPVLGLAIFALGAAAFFGADWSGVSRRLGLGRVDARTGFAGFGVAYGLAGFACTGPIFLPVLVAGFAVGPGTGLAVFAAYTAAVAGVIVGAALAVAAGEGQLLRRIAAGSRSLHRISAAVLALGGLYLAWYAAHAYGFL